MPQNGLFFAILYRSYDTKSVDRLHRGEQQNIADRGAVGQQHNKAIHTEAEAACGGQTILQRVDIVIIDLCPALRLDGLALGDLTLKAGLLVDGVVQLAERIAILGAVDEVLKPLGEGWISLSSTKASKNSARIAPLVGTSGSST